MDLSFARKFKKQLLDRGVDALSQNWSHKSSP